MHPPKINSLEVPIINGTPQFVLLRGKTHDTPVLLVVHGGPGAPLFPFVHDIGVGSGLEQLFTVAYWEQRGTGKTLKHSLDASRMTLEQMVSDTLEVTEWLCHRLSVERIYLMGHSWGTILGTLAAHERPERFYHYVGVGQVGSVARGEAASYRWATEETNRRNHRAAARDLARIGAPPHDHRGMMAERKWVTRFGGFVKGKSYPEPNMLFKLLKTRYYSLTDLVLMTRHPFLALRSLVFEKNAVDLFTQAPELAIPVTFIMGRHDWVTPYEVARAYFERLKAPQKRFISLDSSAHMPFSEDPVAFGAAVRSVLVGVTGETEPHTTGSPPPSK